jgi:endonuclease/exonuclease/phosphatase family metal-dependent hydrolase
MFNKSLFSRLIASAALVSLVTACGSQVSPAAFAPMNPQMAPVGAMNVRAMNASARTQGTMRVATYNIRNLFDGVQNPGKEPEKAKPERELQALAQSMRDINSDVIGFQEVESLETLTAFRDKYVADMGYKYVVLVEAHDPRGIDVALFSRFPVTNVKSHADLKFPVPGKPAPEGFSRDLLQARIQGPNNYNFTLFITHLKSQHGEGVADIKREAEARQAQAIIRAFQQANPRENFIVLGDFNDTPDAPHIAPLVNPQVSGLGTTDIILKDLGNGPNVFTYHPQKYRSRIDYLLVSSTMMNEYVPKSVRLYKPYKQGETWQKLYFYDASDHIPVTADFNITTDR